MRFKCPTDGTFDAKPEVRTTTPAKVKTNPVLAKRADDPAKSYRDGATDGPELSPTHRDHDDLLQAWADVLPAGAVRDGILALVGTREPVSHVAMAAGDPVEVKVGICPKCGSPILAPPKDG